MQLTTEPPVTTHAPGRPLNVLLVEDNDLDVMSLRRAFKRADLPHTLRVVATADDALNVLRDKHPDVTLPPSRRLILLDLNLPDTTGLQFLRRLRDDDDLAAIPVVVITSSDVDRDKYDAFRMNVAGYIIKPVDQESFVNVVDALHHYWSTSELPPDVKPTT